MAKARVRAATRRPRIEVAPHGRPVRHKRVRPPELKPAAIVPGSVPTEAEGTALPRVERPHSQAVCRGCGRILEVPLMLDELRLLADLADRAPPGWRVDGLSFTLMGACQRCRGGSEH
ncbi:MAG TPA: hypothetical protein VGV89_09725 [Thermoplasmata archaeon]|nr:hypothetical protein [Thermoplasmata archaeon]